jgi:hypothetical protein
MTTEAAFVIGMFLGGGLLLILIGGLIWLAVQQEARDQAEMDGDL